MNIGIFQQQNNYPKSSKISRATDLIKTQSVELSYIHKNNTGWIVNNFLNKIVNILSTMYRLN